MKINLQKYVAAIAIFSISFSLFSQQQIIVDQSGGGDYATIQEALNNINGTKLASDVEILIRAGEYHEQLLLEQVDNTDANYSITLRSENGAPADVVLTDSTITTMNERILAIKANFVSVEDLTIKRTSEAYSVAFISLANGITDISFANNVFLNESSNTTYALIDNYDYFSEPDTVRRLTISNNHFSEVIAFSNFSQYYSDINFNNNTLDDLVYDNSGSLSTWVNIRGLVISENTLNGVSLGTFTNCRDVIINSNIIHSDEGGMSLSANYDVGHSTYKIYNNFFVIEDFGVNIALAGLEVDLVNNNFSFTEGYSGFALLLNGYAVTEISNRISVFNNNFYGEGSGSYGVIFYSNPDSLDNTTLEFDYNNYYVPGRTNAWQVVDQQYYDLDLAALDSLYGFESNGLTIDPLYFSETDLHISNVGLKDQGLPIDYITEDIDGDAREGNPDIGADELKGFVNLTPVGSLTITGNLSGGKNIQLQYSAENRGTLNLMGEWKDAIYLSSDDQLDQADRLLKTIDNNFGLESGESYNGDVSLQLPVNIAGGEYFIIMNVNDGDAEYDRDLSDNTMASGVLTFEDPIFPDLEVTSVVTPGNQFSGKSFELQWTVTNNGTGPTPEGWQDYIFVANQAVSLDDPSIVDSDSLFLNRVTAPVTLNPGESYQQTRKVNIPLRYSGTLYYRIQANGNGNITELNDAFESNGRTSQVVNITQSPLPDLAVNQLGVPSTAFSGDKVAVNWTVENVGQQSTYRTSVQLEERDWINRSNFNYWYDRVYISKKPYYDPEEPTQRSAVRYDRGTEELDAGASYTVSDSIEFLPCEYGLYYVFVHVNDDYYTYELTRQNNIVFIDSIELIIDPKPDMLPSDLSISGSASTGRPLEISYTVTNDGFADKDDRLVMNYFYISQLDTLNEKRSVLIGLESFSDPLAQESSYQSTVSYDLPYEEFGEYYLYLHTDAEDNICEVQGEENNVISIPLEIALSEQPDLQPEFSSVPDTMLAGSNYALQFAVYNEGAAAAVQDNWQDKLYFGSGSVYSSDYNEPLAVGDSYLREANFTVDINTQEGMLPLTLVTDARDNLFEFGGEENNTVTREVFISRDPSRVPDLSLETLEIGNTTVTAGDVLMLDYVVQNSSATTPRNGWIDRLRIWNSDGEFVFSTDLKHFGRIESGETFAGTYEVQLPYTLAGEYEFELDLNIGNKLVEYETTNNAATTTANIIAYIPPDLEVQDVQYASCCNLFALQEDELTIDIANHGPGLVDDKEFTLKVWLAEDAAGSNAQPLLAHRQDYNISSGSSISVNVPVSFAAHLSGDYYTIVELDTDEEIYEGKEESNNRYVTGYTVFIDNDPILLYPSDITLTSTTNPEFSQSISIDYTMQKGTEKELRRSLEDQIIISADRTFSGEDYRIAELFPVFRNIPAATASYEGSLRGYIPSYMQPGWYYIGVMADAMNHVLELDETNNVLFTADSFYLDFTVKLELDVPQTLSFYEGTVGGQEAFSLQRPEGKGMLATVDFSEDQASTELFHRVGQMPTSAVFDNRYSNPFMADQEVVVPVTDEPVTDYLRLYANRVPWVDNSPYDFECWINQQASGGGNVVVSFDPECVLPEPIPYTITATSAEYSILRTVPDTASYHGVSNLLIEGFDFEEGMTFSMTDGTATVEARHVTIVSSTEAVAAFDFRNSPAGLYDVVAEKANGNTTVLEDYFTVYEGFPVVPWTAVNHSVRVELVNKKFYINVDFGNYSYMNGYDYWLVFAIAPESGNLNNVSSSYIGSSDEDFYQTLEEHPNAPFDSAYADIDGVRYYAYWLPILPPRSQTTFTYIVDTKEEDYIFSHAQLIPQPRSLYTFMQDLDYLDRSVTVGKLAAMALYGSFDDAGASAKKSLSSTKGIKSDISCDNLNMNKVREEIANQTVAQAEYIYGGTQGMQGAKNLRHAMKMAIDNKRKSFKEGVEGAINVPENAKQALNDIGKDRLVQWVKKEKKWYELGDGVAKDFYESVNPEAKLKEVITPEEVPFENLLDKTLSCITYDDIEQEVNRCYYVQKVNGEITSISPYQDKRDECNYPPGTFDKDGTTTTNSKDPNAIIGPAGVTDAQLLGKQELLKYTVLFENYPEAGAPARFVAVNNDLPGELRSQSFRLTGFGFGDTIIQVEPANRLNYRMKLGKKYNYQELQVVAGIDIVNNRAFWRFSTIDPETGNLTTDPFNGFLPPNDSTGIGEGYVTYEIRIDESAGAGSEILNQADIIFDQNEVIPTNVWSNVIIASDPVSQVNALPEVMEDSVFTISWEGTAGDMSAGILGYDVYVSQDEGPYRRLLEKTSATEASFSGEKGSMYSFYSMLITLDGITEPAPGMADAVTTILADTTNTDTTQVGVEPSLAKTDSDDFSAAVYPVPASDQLSILYASEKEVQLQLLDLNGRVLYERLLKPSRSKSQVSLDISSFRSGVMILHLGNQITSKIYRVVKL